jgi:hypothetical protein
VFSNLPAAIERTPPLRHLGTPGDLKLNCGIFCRCFLHLHCYAKLHINPDSYISSQTSLTRHSHSLRYKPSAILLITSNSASSLIQLSFGMLYHLILSLLLLWISLNHRSKPTTSKQFSILYTFLYM